ncbi:MAG: DMT family transporter [Alphaproteobacteria bacterium]|nr:DMT family transporter [Alphaproteobacteria bacterium]
MVGFGREIRDSAAMASAQSPLRGIAFMVLSVAIFCLMDVLVKLLAQTYHPFQVAFFRSLFALVPIGVMVAASGGMSVLKTRRFIGHAARSVVGIAALLMFFYSFAHMKLADVVAIGFAGPLFITALSVPLLGEQVGWRRWSAVVVGFLGVMLVVNPGSGVFDPVAFIALGAALFYSFAVIVIRKLSVTESNSAIVFYFSIAATTVCGAMMPFLWITPTFEHLALLVLTGLLGGSAQYIMVEAFRWAQVSVLAPFEYTAIFFSLGFGYFLFGESASATMLAGVAIIAASGLYILHRETVRAGRAAVAS